MAFFSIVPTSVGVNPMEVNWPSPFSSCPHRRGGEFAPGALFPCHRLLSPQAGGQAKSLAMIFQTIRACTASAPSTTPETVKPCPF